MASDTANDKNTSRKLSQNATINGSFDLVEAAEESGSPRSASTDQNKTARQFSTEANGLNEVLNRIGSGPYQLVVLLLGGGVYSAEGAMLLMLSIIAKGLITKWQMSPLFAGVMATVVFSGLLIGTFIGGFACDRCGRRSPILATYGLISLFILIAILVPGLMLLVVTQFFLGFALGFGMPAANAIVCESCATDQRSIIYSMTMVLFAFGQIYAALIIWILTPMLTELHLHWRGMLLIAAMLPFVLFIFAYRLLLESPHWLVANGHIREAKEVIKRIAEYKRENALMSAGADSFQAEEIQSIAQVVSPPAVEKSPSNPPERSCCEDTPLLNEVFNLKDYLKEICSNNEMWRLKALFSPNFRATTIMMSYVAFACNFAYYGMIYGLPETMKEAFDSEEDQMTPAAAVFVAAIFEIPGVFISIVLGMTVGRRLNMAIAFFCVSLCMLVIVYALWKDRFAFLGMVGVGGVKLFISSGFIIVYLYLLECYPTKFRATGLAFCMVLGRVGAFGVPFLFDGMILLDIRTIWFFAIMAVSMALAAIVAVLLPYETKDAKLAEDAPPAQGSHRGPGSRQSSIDL